MAVQPSLSLSNWTTPIHPSIPYLNACYSEMIPYFSLWSSCLWVSRLLFLPGSICLFCCSSLLEVSVSDLWISWTRDTIAWQVIHNFSDAAQMGMERYLPGGCFQGTNSSHFFPPCPASCILKSRSSLKGKKKKWIICFHFQRFHFCMLLGFRFLASY